MHSEHLRRTLIRLPLIIFTGVNLVGTFYDEYTYDLNTFVRAGRVIVNGGNQDDLPERLSTNLNPPITLSFFQYLAELDPRTVYLIERVISFLLYNIMVGILASTYHNL